MYLKRYEEWLKKVTAEERKELELIKNNEKEIKERFSLDLAFGTAGMRGIIGLGTFMMNNYSVMRATKGLAQYIKSLGETAMRRGVLVSYDTRKFSFEFALTASRVLAHENINVYLFNNVRPVPMCSFAVRYLGAIAGIMITASHNPKEYNGYKVYGEDGAQLDLDATDVVVGYINKIDNYFSVKMADVTLSTHEEIKERDNYYTNEYIKIVGKDIDEKFFEAVEKQILSRNAINEVANKLHIVYTPIHGSGAMPVSTMLKRIGIPFSVVEKQFYPDENFSTVKLPNPEQKDALTLAIEQAKEKGADVVIGTDPDCDRMGVALRKSDGDYVVLNGNQIGVLLLNYELQRRHELGILPQNAVVVKTIVTTKLTDNIANKYGVKTVDVLTGFKFIGEKIKEWEKSKEYEFIFGYEESYGYLAGTHARDKDAVVASVVFADMTCYYKSKGLTVYEVLNEIYKEYGYFEESSISIMFKGLDGMDKMKKIMKHLVKNRYSKIDNYEVSKVIDINKSKIYLSDGKTEKLKDLPKSNVIKYEFNDFEWCCIRPSGTEPKLKIYVSAFEKTKEESVNKAKRILEFLQNKINEI